MSTDTAFQLATYQQLMPGARPLVRIDTLVKTKTPQLVQQDLEIGARQIQAIETLYPLAQKVMRRGSYMPNRLSNLCSRRNCPYWSRCEREFGGHVGCA